MSNDLDFKKNPKRLMKLFLLGNENIFEIGIKVKMESVKPKKKTLLHIQ